jgi:hypothetical protein
MTSDTSWNKIVKKYKLDKHDFSANPFPLSAQQIKDAVGRDGTTAESEVRILCKQDTRESRPQFFKDNGLFLLPVKNGNYMIIRGEGYFDIPAIVSATTDYKSKLTFKLLTAEVGNSEMQYLDFAYATSLVRSFIGDDSLVLTIRGRKYTPAFDFKVGRHTLSTVSVQTEVDAGFEGKDRLVLVEAKSAGSTNVIIRQIYYPYRQWKIQTGKDVVPLFFEKSGESGPIKIWQLKFTDDNDYNSVQVVKSGSFVIKQ